MKIRSFIGSGRSSSYLPYIYHDTKQAGGLRRANPRIISALYFSAAGLSSLIYHRLRFARHVIHRHRFYRVRISTRDETTCIYRIQIQLSDQSSISPILNMNYPERTPEQCYCEGTISCHALIQDAWWDIS